MDEIPLMKKMRSLLHNSFEDGDRAPLKTI